MGRYKQNFSLYPRKLANGAIVWYYRTYTPDGIRTTGKSTMCSSKAKARMFCEELIRNNLLFDGSNLTFGMYAENWFADNSRFLKEKKVTGDGTAPFSKSTMLSYNSNLKLHILPYFREIRLKDITPDTVREFRDTLIAKKLSQTSIRLIMVPLKTILNYAYIEGLIVRNPFAGIMTTKASSVTHDAFSEEDALTIIRQARTPLKYICLVAALTGMRKSEIFGLRRQDFKDTYIDLREQFLRGERVPLKTKDSRKIPVCTELKELLFKVGGSDYIFSYYDVSRDMKKVFNQNDFRDIKERNLSFHSWRHFFNTYMASKGVDGRIIAAVSGHSVGVSSVQSVYINFKIEDFKDIITEQKAFIKMLNQKQCLT